MKTKCKECKKKMTHCGPVMICWDCRRVKLVEEFEWRSRNS